MKNILYLSICFILFSQCQLNSPKQKKVLRPSGETLAVTYKVVSHNPSGKMAYQAFFTIENNSEYALDSTEWALYFNQSNRRIKAESVTDIATIEQISGDWYRLSPTEKFALAAGEKVKIEFEASPFMIKESDAPIGLYFVFKNEEGKDIPEEVSNYTLLPFDSPAQTQRSVKDKVKVPTAASVYEQNAQLQAIEPAQLSKIVPTPATFALHGGQFIWTEQLTVQYQKGLKKEAKFLATALKQRFEAGVQMKTTEQELEASGHNIILSLSMGPSPDGQAMDSYHLDAPTTGNLSISAYANAGIFYGIQSLLALLPLDSYARPTDTIALEAVSVVDVPRFAYRGMHLDVSRNFHKKEAVLKLLDLMAFYKLNKLHFHLTDDEGWRLEIPKLPELTLVGAFRGHTLDETDFLHPSYGSGPFADSKGSYGNGFYTQEDFIEILRYATERHIEVIPEFDTPGHARAAIVAMKARYRRLLKTGREEEAKTYLLHDVEDESEYRSVQDYNDNVICVCQEATYHFLETVVDAVQQMYQEAKAPLKAIHIGGDEVPKGVWEKSPACQQLIDNTASVKSTEDLSFYFYRRWNEILKQRNIKVAGWEEIALKKNKRNGNSEWVANPEFTNEQFIPYVWQNLWGNQDLGYKLANAGYPVVLCNVTNLYFDLAYNKDPLEPGLYWGGFVDTRKAYEFAPHDVFKSTNIDPYGQAFSLANYRKNQVQLKSDSRNNIYGIQGQLWSETVKGQAAMEYYIFPKLLGLAERAWAQQPEWATIENDAERANSLQEDWNVFAHTLGNRELYRLSQIFGGVQFRIPPPGAIIEDGQLNANIAFPGLSIRYTTDGSEPTVESQEYTDVVPVMGQVKLRAFDSAGRGSRVLMVGLMK